MVLQKSSIGSSIRRKPGPTGLEIADSGFCRDDDSDGFFSFHQPSKFGRWKWVFRI
jgi:hypothetical protein